MTRRAASAQGLRRAARVAAVFLLFFLLASGAGAACLDDVAVPESAGPGAEPSVIVLDEADAIAAYALPACLGLRFETPPATLVALRASPANTSLDQVIARIAAFSTLETVRYWSKSRQEWRLLVSETQALSGPDPEQAGTDPAPGELVTGAVFFALQDDSDPLSAIVMRMEVVRRDENAIVITFENVTASTMMGLTVLPVGSLRSVVAVERNGEDGLDFYLLSGNSANLPAWLLPAKASHINRAVAVYRHLAGIPSDAEPPAAP
ncbi:MAG: DUF6675 family protein [Geminicoccaceae bacterium]